MGSTVQPKKLGGRLVADALSFATEKSSGLFVVAYMVMRNASLPSASAFVPGLLGESDSKSFVVGDGLREVVLVCTLGDYYFSAMLLRVCSDSQWLSRGRPWLAWRGL